DERTRRNSIPGERFRVARRAPAWRSAMTRTSPVSAYQVPRLKSSSRQVEPGMSTETRSPWASDVTVERVMSEDDTETKRATRAGLEAGVKLKTGRTFL